MLQLRFKLGKIGVDFDRECRLKQSSVSICHHQMTNSGVTKVREVLQRKRHGISIEDCFDERALQPFKPGLSYGAQHIIKHSSVIC
mgnify:CR=1 FL=1